jgi:hypothetical protein
LNYNPTPFVKVVEFWQKFIQTQSITGSNLFLRSNPDGLTQAKIIIPKGTGPVIEMISPALNEDHALWQIKSFLNMAKRREEAAGAATAAK